MGVMEWFASGGLFMWFVLFSALIALAVTIGGINVCTDKNKSVYLEAIVLTSLLPVIIGGLGCYQGYAALMSVVPMVDPSLNLD